MEVFDRMDWSGIQQYLEYAGCYTMLKLARTILLSIIWMLLLLLFRKVWDTYGGKTNPASRLYGKACLWLILIPVPFLGGLKLSYEHFHLRNRLYVVMYEFFMTHTIVAKLYFAGMVVTALILFVRKRRLRAWVKRLSRYYGPLQHDCGRRWGRGVQIRITPQCITPFTIGLLKPVIVLPEYMFQKFDEREIEAVLKHEYCHIRRGHLLVYGVLDLFRVLWYVNPLVHICARNVKNDLEMICDHEVIQGNSYDPECYGMTLLKSLTLIESEPEGVPALFRGTSFTVMKQRIRAIARYREYPKRQIRMLYTCSVVVMLVLFVSGSLASYPAYTPYEGYALYSMDGRRRILEENDAFNSAVEKSSEGLIVDNRKVKKLLLDAEIYNDEGEYWIYYGGYMKMPGIGGGGSVLYYNTTDAPDGTSLLPYNETNLWIDCMGWLFQHM